MAALAGSLGMLVMPLLFLAFSQPALAANYTVGDDSGWNLGIDYNEWASHITFKAGDTLIFNYFPSHAVHQLASQSDFDACKVDSPIVFSISSPTAITLEKADTTYYFVCGVNSHCELALKFSLKTAPASKEIFAPAPGEIIAPSVLPSSAYAAAAPRMVGVVAGALLVGVGALMG